jgi:hypothetical protein
MAAPAAAPKAVDQSAAAGEKKEESGGFFDWF